LQVKEPNLEQLARGKTVYEPPRYMSVAQSIEQLIEVEEARGEGVYSAETMAVGLARIGSEDQVMAAGPLSLLKDYEMGPPLHAMIICGELHDLELAFLKTFEIAEGCVLAQGMPAFAKVESASVPALVEEVVELEDPAPVRSAPTGPRVPVAASGTRADSDDDELEMDCGEMLDMEDCLDN